MEGIAGQAGLKIPAAVPQLRHRRVTPLPERRQGAPHVGLGGRLVALAQGLVQQPRTQAADHGGDRSLGALAGGAGARAGRRDTSRLQWNETARSVNGR
jgi:hypothetical protein